MTAKRSGLGKGLGKGLDSLIPDNRSTKKSTPLKEKVEEPVLAGEKMVKINMIEPNREQPRRNFEEDSLLELSESIKQFGVLQPLLVQKKGDYYEIIAGERGREVMRVNVQGDGIGAAQAFPGLFDQHHGLFHTRLGTIETGCFKPLFHGFVRPGADIEPGARVLCSR